MFVYGNCSRTEHRCLSKRKIEEAAPVDKEEAKLSKLWGGSE